MDPNKYFSGLPVNTNESSVHVPTNVFDGDPKASAQLIGNICRGCPRAIKVVHMAEALNWVLTAALMQI